MVNELLRKLAINALKGESTDVKAGRLSIFLHLQMELKCN